MLTQIDEMVEFAVQRIVGSPDGFRHVTRELAKGYPDVSGLQIVFVLVSTAHAVEKVFAPEQSGTDPEVNRIFWLAGLLSSDLFALQVRGNTVPTGADLVEYWTQEDQFFLNL